MAVGVTNLTGGFVNYIAGITNTFLDALLSTASTSINVPASTSIKILEFKVNDGAGSFRFDITGASNFVNAIVFVNGVSVYSSAEFAGGGSSFTSTINFNKGDVIRVNLRNLDTNNRPCTLSVLKFRVSTPLEQLNFFMTT
jgi:hypothetical protein